MFLGTKARSRVELLGDAALELDVGSFGAVEELEVADERNLRIDVFQVPDLAPAVVAEHDVGEEARLLERKGSPCDFLPIQHPCLCLAKVAMGMARRLPLRCVNDLLHVSQRTVLSLRYGNDCVSVLSAKVACEMEILPREVLMYQKYLHIRDAGPACEL